MTRAITIGLALIAVGAAVLAIAWGNLALGVLAIVTLLLVATSAAGPGRIVAQCHHLSGRTATLHIWGSAPQVLGDGSVVVERVWALGAGLHLHVRPGTGASPRHIKVAQPLRWSIDDGGLTIAEAKYVQVSGKTVERVVGRLALELRPVTQDSDVRSASRPIA